MSDFKKEKFAKGRIIFHDGDEGNHMCEVLSGTVGIYKNYGEKNEKLLTTLEAGSYFGEMGLIDELPRSAAAVADDYCELLFISEQEFPEYLKTNPETAIKIMRTLSTRLRELTGDFMEACGTIAETLETEEKKKSKGLLRRLKKFADIYVDSCETAYNAEMMGVVPGRHAMFYNGYNNWY